MHLRKGYVLVLMIVLFSGSVFATKTRVPKKLFPQTKDLSKYDLSCRTNSGWELKDVEYSPKRNELTAIVSLGEHKCPVIMKNIKTGKFKNTEYLNLKFANIKSCMFAEGYLKDVVLSIQEDTDQKTFLSNLMSTSDRCLN